MIIQPYSALTESKLLPIRDNFPALAMFFPCSETSGLTLTDTAYGIQLLCSALTFPASGAVAPNFAANKPTVGEIRSAGTKKVVIVGVGNPGVAGVLLIGNSTSGQGDYINCNPIAPVVRQNTTSVSGTAYTGSAVHAWGMFADINGGDVTTFDTASGSYTEQTPVALTGITSLASIQNRVGLTNHTSIYGIAVFYFTAIPTDVKPAIQWMEANWRNGVKALYPGWRGKT
jgi:hypothetical protein